MREFETERLLLRHLRKDDDEAIFSGWASDPEVTKYLTWHPHTDIEETRYIISVWLDEYNNSDTYRYVIERKSDKALIGMIDVVGYDNGAPVLGYCSGKRFWGNGYMTEACKAVIKELFDAGFETILIEAVDENIGSNRVIEKCGFSLVKKEMKQLSSMKPDVMSTILSYKLDK